MSQRDMLETFLWASEPTPEARRERLRCGNGYFQWLQLPTFDPQFILDVYGLFLKQDMEALIEKARHMPVVLDRKKALEWVDRHYQEMGIDPRDIQATKKHELHFLNATAMMPVIIAGVMGRWDIDKNLLRQIGSTDSIRWFHGYNVWKHRNQTFKITPALATKLLLTEIRGLEWEDFHLPFPSFIIQVPSDLVMLHDPDTGNHPLDTIMVTGAKDGDDQVIGFMFLGQENENSKGMGDDTLLYFNLYSKGTKTLDESLERTLSKDGDLRGVDNPVTLAGDRSRTSLEQVVRFAINIITYINSVPKDVVRQTPPGWDKLKEKAARLAGRKRERILQKMKDLKGPGNPFLVGSHVVIDKNLERVVKEGRENYSPSPTSVASYIRGHWTHQPYGPARSLRRLQWIEPYWRNLGAKEEGSKDYTVK